MDARREDEKPKWLPFNIRTGNTNDYVSTNKTVENSRKNVPNSHSKGQTSSSTLTKIEERAKIDEDEMKTNSCHSEIDNSEKMKTKLMSMWNNMKYGWTVKVKTNFSYESPIWLLGKCYHKKLLGQEGDFSARNASIELFKQDFSSRIWFTYRREFPTLAGSNLTTDCGWGCMLRSGQMLLAQALVCHFLGSDWKWNSSQTPINDVYHRMIIKWFADHPCSSSPFSVHRLVSVGENSGKKAGEWYGPASVAYILKQAVENAAKEIPLLDSICVYVAQDCTIYQQDVFDLCATTPRKRSFCKYALCDEKDNPSSKSCDTKSCTPETKVNYVSSQLRNSPIKVNGMHHSNTMCEETEKMHEMQDLCTLSENIQKSYQQISDSYISLFNKNSGNSYSTFGEQNNHAFNNYNHSSSDFQVDNVLNIKDRTSVCNDLANSELTSKNVTRTESSPVFVDSVCNSTKPNGRNTKLKRSTCSERRSFLSRSASVPPPSSEETSNPAVNDDHNNDCKNETKDFLCSSSCSEYCSRWKSVIILVPVRLGGEILNRTYIPRVRDMLTQEHCIGIIGGRPKHSLYFIGWQDDKLIYLDPHYCQEVVDICVTDFPLQSFHCTAPRKMTCTRMDPSCTIGFYCKTKKDFLNFTKSINQILAPYKTKGDYPIFTIQEGKCTLATLERDVIARERSESLDQPWSFDDDLGTIEINNEDFVII